MSNSEQDLHRDQPGTGNFPPLPYQNDDHADAAADFLDIFDLLGMPDGTLALGSDDDEDQPPPFQPDPHQQVDDDEEEYPEAPDSPSRTAGGARGYFDPDHGILARRDAPQIVLNTETGGLSKLFSCALFSQDDVTTFRALAEQLLLSDQLVFVCRKAQYELAVLNMGIRQKYGLNLPNPDQLSDDTIRIAKRQISAHQQITGNMVQEHLDANIDVRSVEEETERQNQMARDGQAAVWEAAAFGSLQASDRLSDADRIDYVKRLTYAVFQCEPAQLIALMAPPMSMAAKVEKASAGLVVQLMNIYDSMSCHADAARLVRLCATGGQVQQTKGAWIAQLAPLRAVLADQRNCVCHVMFPGHSMCLVRLESTIDFYESVAGHGVNACVMTALATQRPKRSLDLQTVLKALTALMSCDELRADDEDNEEGQRSLHLERGFGFGNSALGVPADGDWDLSWTWGEMATPEEITDRIRQETVRAVALIDILARAPFRGDQRPFLVLVREATWVISLVGTQDELAIADLALNQQYRFAIFSQGSGGVSVKGTVLRELLDRHGSRIGLEVRPDA